MKNIKTINLGVLSIIGSTYLLTGFTSVFNWFMSVIGVDHRIYPSFMPGDLGSALISLTVGASLIASLYYALRRDESKYLIAAVCGLWLALGALMIQLMTVIATVLDALILGEEINYLIINEHLLRIDVILGCIAVPASIHYTLVLMRTHRIH